MNKDRFKNIYFWLGLVAVVLTALNIAPESLTSWNLVGDAIVEMFMNPFKLGTVVVAVIGVFVNPTTRGLKDGTN